MKERQRRDEPPSLLPETRSLLDEIKRCTGCPVEVRADPSLRGYSRAAYVASDADASRHLILYDPTHERFLDHLVAHECGHIVRLSAASPSERQLPVMTVGNRRAAAEQLLPEIEHLLDSGLSEAHIAELLPLWLRGTISQVHNMPADIHIERWIQRNFPTVRKTQDASLVDQARELHRVLGPEIAARTPPTIWRASNAMNYAFVKEAGQLLSRPGLTLPYGGTVKSLGEELYAMVDRAPDTGFAGDRELTDRWAQHLGVSDWLTWQRLDALPAERRHIWEYPRNPRR